MNHSAIEISDHGADTEKYGCQTENERCCVFWKSQTDIGRYESKDCIER